MSTCVCCDLPFMCHVCPNCALAAPALDPLSQILSDFAPAMVASVAAGDAHPRAPSLVATTFLERMRRSPIPPDASVNSASLRVMPLFISEGDAEIDAAVSELLADPRFRGVLPDKNSMTLDVMQDNLSSAAALSDISNPQSVTCRA